MSDEHELDDEAPPDIPDISSDPPPAPSAPSAPPAASEPPNRPSDAPDSEPDPYDIEVDEEEVEVHVDEPVEPVPEKPASGPPPRKKRGKRNTIPQTPVARASVRPPEPADDELSPESLRPPKTPRIELPTNEVRVSEVAPSKPPPRGSEPPRPVSEPPRPASVPPRPASVPPRPISAPPRPLSDPPRPLSDPPRPLSDPPKAVSAPPRPVSEPPSAVDTPPPTARVAEGSRSDDDEESPWPPLTQEEVDRELAERAARRAQAEEEPPPSSAATSYPPPPVVASEGAEPGARTVKAARIIQARKESVPPPSPGAGSGEGAGVEAPAATVPLADTPLETPAVSTPLIAEAGEAPAAALATAQELEGAEELTDDDIAPESEEPPEVVDVEVTEEPDEAAAASQAVVAEDEHAIDVPVEVEAPQADGTPKPPPPPRRSAFDEARKLAQQKAEARRQAEEARRAAGGEEAKRPRRAWWEELFGEDFARAAGTLTEGQVTGEADFIEESLGVAKGGVVLDLGCGAGYHAVDLARRGYGVVGYDLSLHQLALAADVAQQSGQKLNLLQGDMREMAFEEMFDGIYCWNTSFGYFEEEKNVHVAQRIFRALRPGGMFLLDVANRDFVVAHQPGQTWFEGDACVCMDDMNVDFITSRLRVKRSLILDDGRSMECNYSIRLYGLHELGKILHDVGFRVTEASGHPSTPGVFFGASSPRVIILAQRP